MIKASVAYEMMEKALHLIPSHESNSTYLSAIVDGVYTDPFEEDGIKHAIIYREKTNEPPKDVTAKTLKKNIGLQRRKENNNRLQIIIKN